MDYFNQLTGIELFFYATAFGATAILIVQTILAVIGLSGGGLDGDISGDSDVDVDIDTDFDVDTDFDIDADMAVDALDSDVDIDSDTTVQAGEGASIRFVTLRGLVAFFSIFGWVGIATIDVLPIYMVLVLAISGGLLAMFIIGYLFYMMNRMQASGNINYINGIGQVAEVYLRIPAQREYSGKIVLTIQERLVEMAAVTDEPATIPSGAQVKVVRVLPNNTALVAQLKK